MNLPSEVLSVFAVSCVLICWCHGEESAKNVVQIRNKYILPGGRAAYVFDNAIAHSQVLALKTFVTTNDNWRYVIHDPHSASKEHLFDDRNGMPWKSWKDPMILRTTDIGKRIKVLVESVDRASKNLTKKRDFEMNEIYGALLRRGDRTNLIAEGDPNEDSYTVAAFTNIVWRKNSYGEMLLYDDDGEILTAIRAKFGRIIIWHSSIKYIFRPPSIAELSTQCIIMMHFGYNNDTNMRKASHYKTFVDEIRRPPSLSSTLQDYKNKMPEDIDVSKHLSLYRKNKKNHFVAVFDGLFNDVALSAIRAWTIKYGLYFFDGSLDVTSDNVQWIAAINVEDFVKTDFWPIISKIASYVSNTSDWYPYDVACNLIRSHDHTRFHLDTSDRHEKEMTFLLYLSPNWTATDYGETAFMETNDDRKRNEYVAEVVPTFGRAVIFDGNFPHSAHPPSVQHHHARYTLAVKLSYNKVIAVQKTFSEEMRHDSVMASTLKNLWSLKHNPENVVAQSKVFAVAEHLATRNLQNQLSGADFSEDIRRQNMLKQGSDDDDDQATVEHDNNRPSEEMDEEGEESSDNEAVMAFMEQLQELELGLTEEQGKTLMKMAEYHNFVMDEEAPHGYRDPVIDLFVDDKREIMIQKWQKESGNNGDMLADYVQLFLAQRVWLKDYAMGKMTTLM